MRKSWLIMSIVMGALMVGCEKESTKSSAPAVPAPPAAPRAPTAAASGAAPAAPQSSLPAIPNSAAVAPATTQAADTANAEAQKLVDQAVAYIKENKLDLADKALTQVEGMKAS